MKRRGFLKSVASIPVVPGHSIIGKNRESTKVVVNMRFQNMMDKGSLRVLKHGDVDKDIEIQNRDLWNLTADYYANKSGLFIPSIRGFELYKFLFHQEMFWSLGYQKPGYTLHMIDSVDGEYRSMLFDIVESQNVAVAETDDFGRLVEKTKYLLQEHIEHYNE